MQFTDYLDDFVADWRLTGRSATTAVTYRRYLEQLWGACGPDVDLGAVKTWLAGSVSAKIARARARAVRAFGKWDQDNDGPGWVWWPRVPLASTSATPQPTVTKETVTSLKSRMKQTVRTPRKTPESSP